MHIKIDTEFLNLIPPLSEDEYKQLEANCVREGIRDALVVWPQPDGDNILIDGHNRFKIAEKHGLEYRTQAVSFEERDEAKLWIIDNQLGRRNLIAYVATALVLKKKEILAKQKHPGARNDLNPDQKSGRGEKKENMENRTDRQLAKLAGVSHDTIHKVDVIEHSDNALVKEAARRGDISINNAYQQIVREKTPVPPKPTSVTIEAKQRHAEFEQKKSEGVVSIQDARQDKDDQKKIGEGLYRDLLSWLTKGYWIGALNNSKDFDRLESVIPEDEKKDLCEKVSKITMVLDKFYRALHKM